MVGTDLVLREHVSVHWQHPTTTWPQFPLAQGELFPALALQECCPETLPQLAWEQCCCSVLVCLSSLQWGHLELVMMWLAQQCHCLWQEPLRVPLVWRTQAAHVEHWWEPEGHWSGGWQHLARRPQPLPLPGGCLESLDLQGELPR